MAQETIDLVHAFYKDDEYSRQLPGKKDYVKHTEKCLQTKAVSSVWCNLHELFVAFKERNPGVKTEFSKFCTLHRKWSFRAEMCQCVTASHQENAWYASAQLIQTPLCSRRSKLRSYIQISYQ